MSPVGIGHLSFALVALASGTAVVLGAKGTPLHVRLGKLFVVAMVGTNATAFMIYDLHGGFGQFHVAAAASTLAMLPGVWAVVGPKTDPRWLPRHAFYMSWTYVGLVAAGVAQIASRVLPFPFDANVALSIAIVVLAGAWVIRARLGQAWRPPTPDAFAESPIGRRCGAWHAAAPSPTESYELAAQGRRSTSVPR